MKLQLLKQREGYQCYLRHYESARTIAQLVYLHGIQSHSGWYTLSGKMFADAGITVYAPDRRGSGLNTAMRGDVLHHRLWVQDVVDLLEKLPRDLPTFLLGVSWGGKLAVAAWPKIHQYLSGQLLIVPGLCPSHRIHTSYKLMMIASAKMTPDRYRPIPFLRSSDFTEDPDRLQFIQQDRHTLREVTNRFLLMNGLLDRRWKKHTHTITTPTLLQLAGRDRIIDATATKQLVQRFQAPVAIQTYENAVHTLEFEPNVEEIVQAQIDWIKSRLNHVSTKMADSIPRPS